MKRVMCIVAAGLAVTSCATRANKIEATYVSPSVYSASSCKDIISERKNIADQVLLLTKKQNKKATDDAVAVGIGVVIFWPALFLLAAGDDKKAELASYKGNYDALTQAGIKKRCFEA